MSTSGPIPHICNLFYTGRILESQYFTPKNYEQHPKITTNSPKKCKICSFSRSIWEILHQTEFCYTGTVCGACNKYEACLSPPIQKALSLKAYLEHSTHRVICMEWHILVKLRGMSKKIQLCCEY